MVIATSTAILGAAALGAGAAMSASSSAARAQKNAAKANAETIANTQAQNNALLAPYVQAGSKATDAIQAFLGIGGDAAAQDQAFKNWRDSTGYQFTLNQGLDAVNSNLALKSQLKSGTAMKAAIKYGSDLANTTGQQYLGNLERQQGVGLNAAGANVSANSSAAGAQVANTNALAGAKADNAMNQANAFTNALGDAFSAYGLNAGQKTDSSYGGLPDKKKANALRGFPFG